MSSKYTESHEVKNTVKCKICDGDFVPGGVRFSLPFHTCIWCYTRSGGGFKGPGKVYSRMMFLYNTLSFMVTTHEEGCACQGCRNFLAAQLVLDPESAKIKESETTSPQGQEGST